MIITKRALIGLLLFIGIIKFAPALDGSNIGLLLSKADELRSSDKAAFGTLIADLEKSFDNMTIKQKYFYIYLKGYQSAYKGNVPSAIKSYEHVVDNSQDVVLRYRAAASLINLYAFTSKWEKGFHYIDVIERLESKILDLDIRHNVIVTSAIFYNEIEQYDSTIQLINRLIREGVQGRNLCMAYGLLLKAKLGIKEEFNSTEEFTSAIDACQAHNENVIANVIRTYLGWNHLDKNQGQKALDAIAPFIQEIEDSQYQLMITDAHAILAHAYWLTGNPELSKQYALKVVNKPESAVKIVPIVRTYKLLYEIELKQNNLNDAIEYLKQFSDSEKIRYNNINAKNLAIESAKYKSEQKDNQIELLNKQNQILQLEKELSNETATFNRWLIILLVLVATILVLWLFYVKRSQQRLRFLAEYDSLTKISNRAHFTQNAEDILVYYRNNERTASLILFDLDNFKKINDTNGHLVGDEVLRLTAAACKSCVRKVDVFGRVGGEEFAILLPGCEHEQALKIAEDCRQKVNEIDTTQIGHGFDISASFGVTDTGASGYELKDLLANADEAMYLAKRRGRNRVVQHTKD